MAQAEAEAQEAAMEGDEEGVNEAVEEHSEAQERGKAALEAWDGKKKMYRWLNTLGIPFVFAIFGFLRWRMRQARRKTLKL